MSKVKKSLKATNENSESIENEDKDMSVALKLCLQEINTNVLSGSSNIHNDALLHRLVHTQLLSGSLSPESSLTAAQRRKALAGRVSELAGGSKLGKGEHNVRQDEKKLASKRIRDGMMAKQTERDINSLTEVCQTSVCMPFSFRHCARPKTWETITLPSKDCFPLQVVLDRVRGTVD